MGTGLRISKAGVTRKLVSATVMSMAVLGLLQIQNASADAEAPPGTSSTTATQREIVLGEVLEKQDRVDEAEKAYEKAIEGAVSPSDAEAARNHLVNLEKNRETIFERYIKPSWDEFRSVLWKTLVGFAEATLVFAVLWVFRAVLRRRRGYFRRSTVKIGDFANGAGDGAAISFRQHVERALELVREYYKPRFLWHFADASLTVLVVPDEGDDLFEIASEVVPGMGGRALAFLKESFSAPRYRLSGVVHGAGGHYAFLIKLEDRGETVKVWENDCSAVLSVQTQQDLAYRVALRLKEYVDDRGNE